MAGPDTIPFRQADSNGHYKAKQLPDDQADFLEMLNLPETGFGDVIGSGTSTANQMPVYLDTTGKRITPYAGTGLVKVATGTVSTTTAPAGAIVGTSDVQTLTNKTLNGCTINGLTGLTKADVGLANVDNTSDANKPVSSAQAAAIGLKEDKSNKGAVNGYAALDAGGKVPVSQLPASATAVTSVNARTGDVVLNKTDVVLGNVDNTSDANKPISTVTQSALNAKEDKSNKGVASGYASLDTGGTVPLAQLPSSVTGASQYKGTWNATTNIPSITTGSAPGKNGWYYVVSVAGTTTVDGISSWAVGDQIISNGTVWQKIPNVNAVTSVNTYTGAVVLVKADVGLGNADNTSDANKPVSTAQQTALNAKESTANKGVANGYAGLDGAGRVPAAQLPAQAVTSVASKTGDVTLVKADVGLSNVDNTSDATKNSAIATLTNKTLTSPTINGGTLSSVTLSSPAGLTKADVGLSNVDNTSDSTKNAAIATLTNKTLTSPVINTPTGIVKADVGLGNVDNTSDATKNAAAVTLTNKTINGASNTLTVRLDADVSNSLPPSRLNSGTGANATTFWRGDGVWAPPAGGGDVLGPGSAVDGEVVSFNGTSGKIVKASGGKLTANLVSGPASVTSGRVASYGDTTGKVIADGGKLAADLAAGPASAVDGQVALYNGTTGKLLKASALTGLSKLTSGVQSAVAAPTGVVVGDTDTQTLTNKTLTTPVVNDSGVTYRPTGLLFSTAITFSWATVGETAAWTYNIPAGLWSTDGDTIKIISNFFQTGTTGAAKGYRIKIDSTLIWEFTSSPTANQTFWINFQMVRGGAALVRYTAARIGDNLTSVADFGSFTTIDTATAHTIGVYVNLGSVAGGNSTGTRETYMEFWPAP
jgi:hypothetical protein